MKKALLAIAPAVLNGGFSTFLAVALLAFSDVYVFVSFFKVFFLVVFFGLYNGLVFLPVILTLSVATKTCVWHGKQDFSRIPPPAAVRQTNVKNGCVNFSD